MLTEKEQLALEQLEAEHSRRIDEKVEKGIAIRVPPTVVIMGVAEDVDARIEDAKTWTIAQLKAAGETREIYFEDDAIEVIITGVPRDGRDNEAAVERLIERAKQDAHRSDPLLAKALKAREAPQAPPPPEPEPEPERRPIRATIELPTDNSLGAVVEGSYVVRDNMVYVFDDRGQPIGRHDVSPGDNAEAIARRLLRLKRGVNAFYRQIKYPPTSIH